MPSQRQLKKGPSPACAFVAQVFRDNGAAAAQSTSGNVGRLPDEDFCADLDAVVEVDHVWLVERRGFKLMVIVA